MKKIMTLALALALASASSQAFAGNDQCTVTAVKESSITLECSTSAETFKSGDKVQIKAEKKQKAIEGC